MNKKRIHVDERIQDGAVVVSVSGDPVSRLDVAPLRRKIRRLVNDGARTVVVDLSRVNRLGAAMLGELIMGLTTIRDAGGDLRLSGVSGRIEKILRTTKLSGVFKKAKSGTLEPDADHRTVKKVA